VVGLGFVVVYKFKQDDWGKMRVVISKSDSKVGGGMNNTSVFLTMYFYIA